jgi:hypothetical protein
MAGAVQGGRDYAKWGFFGFLALCLLAVIYADERFLVLPNHPEWKHIAPFRWLLLPHGLFGAIALLAGPIQFSDTIRRVRPVLHHWAGYIYIGAVAVAAPLALSITLRGFEPRSIYIEQWFQAGGWFLTTAIALLCILRLNIQAHKRWMMRSYGFALVFVLSRVPDAVPGFHWNDQLLADVLWGLVVTALFAPDLILTTRELMRPRQARPVRAKAEQAKAA